MRTDLFDYDLPEELIAQEPAARRDASRLLVVDRDGDRQPHERHFAELPDLLDAGDLIVINDAKVYPARLWGRRATGGTVEIVLLRPAADAGESPASTWEALVRPGKRVREGEIVTLAEPAAPAGDADKAGAGEVRVLGEAGGGRRLVSLPHGGDVISMLESWGSMPLPPYIHREPGDRRADLDRDRYQTVYAASPGAVAAPTAGLHFTAALLERLGAAGIEIATLTLDVGPGTFQPVRVDDVTEHRMEAETYDLPADCVEAIGAAKQRGNRVVAVGTTVVRTLEHAARAHGDISGAAGQGSADLFIYPGFEFRVVDAMLTNFHLPRSTPILMVSALAGRQRLLAAYEVAVSAGFRFYSYGDAMLIR